MARRKAHAPLNVFINNRLVGRLRKEASGAVRFQYDQTWLDWGPAFAISLSLPMRETAYSGEAVVAVFDNLLPDSPNVRRRVAERMGAQGADYFSLLAAIGRDCVGAMQFLPDDVPADVEPYVQGEPVSDDEIEAILASLATAPLGMDKEQEFRISIAGAQEKTALLRLEGQWMRPIGTTPTTHLLKPQLGEIPTAFGPIDMAASVDNEHYCLKLLAALMWLTPRSSRSASGACWWSNASIGAGAMPSVFCACRRKTAARQWAYHPRRNTRTMAAQAWLTS